jgi:hypothetical protein
MEKSKWGRDGLMVFSEPYIIQQKRDGAFCCAQAEEFARNFFSDKDRRMDDAKIWLIGILYHERKDSIPELSDLTGYGHENISNAIRMTGSARSVKEATNIAALKRYGKTVSQLSSERMQKRWDNDDGSYRDKVSDATSKGTQRAWDNDKDGSYREKVRKACIENIKRLKAEKAAEKIMV